VVRLRGPRPLERKDRRDGFHCGVASLDTWLVEHAPGADVTGSARTYVVIDEEQDRVIAYYALTVASLEREVATGRASKGMPRHPTPAMLLARLAADEPVQGEGIGASPSDPMNLQLLIKDIEATIEGG
jgi:hypothetical protein